MYLYDLPSHRKNVPEMIKDPVELIKDVRALVERHCKDKPELAITGRPVLTADLNKSDNYVLSSRLKAEQDDEDAISTGHLGAIDTVTASTDPDGDFVTPQNVANKSGIQRVYKKNGTSTNGQTERSSGNGTSNNAPRRRRRRCKTCAPCNSSECGHCAFCLDMVSIFKNKISVPSKGEN